MAPLSTCKPIGEASKTLEQSSGPCQIEPSSIRIDLRHDAATAIAITLLLISCFLATGCRPQPVSLPHGGGNAVDAAAVAGKLRAMMSPEPQPAVHSQGSGNDSQNAHKTYEALQYAPAWVREGQATPQALIIIAALENSQQKGLIPEDYEASLWPSRLATLKGAPGNADAVAQFDAALTVDAIRYLSNIRVGRVNPKPLDFGVDLDQRHYDLPQFLVDEVLSASNLQEVLNKVEPQYLGYQRTESALHTYLGLEGQEVNQPLPASPKTVKSGDAYSGVKELGNRLRLLGDLPQSDSADPSTTVYDARLVAGVKHFQARHGLKPDGRLDTATLQALNVPLSTRVIQLEDSLERWRWLPADYPQLPVAVNIPGFTLRVFSDDHTIAMRMNVVVGKALNHQTPVFAKEMKYIIFRPYWNLPLDIVRAEIVPKLRVEPHYLARKGFEATDQNGRVVAAGAVSHAMLAEIESGRVLVRQKPGPRNALGLVKFIFPNEFDIYLHSTPSPQLFNQSRRDFSHGCIRVEKPAELAAWLLRDQPKWTLENIKAAMQSGPDNHQVNLSKPVPVVIVYLTAIVEENGEVYFFDDIYGLDGALNDALAKNRTNR
jgi:murein L,D-transpeptidase YcbB/YkuD